MSTLLDYVRSYDSVRAMLGVSAREMKDDVLSNVIYLHSVESEIDGVDLGIRPRYLELVGPLTSGEAEPDPGLSPANPAENDNDIDDAPDPNLVFRFLRSVQMFSICAVARQSSGARAMGGMRSITDGDAKWERFQEAFEFGTSANERLYWYWRAELRKDWAEMEGVDIAPFSVPLAGVSEPDYDPITGEG